MKLEYMDFDFSEARKAAALPPDSIDAAIDIVKAELNGGNLQLDFSYTATYVPQGSYIRILGRAGFSGPEARDAYAEWKTDKRIGGRPGEEIMNAINYSASLNAVFIARIFNLMPPVVPPTIKLKQK